MSLEMCSWQQEAENAHSAGAEMEWNVSMAMPMLHLAEQYERILQSLGFQTEGPVEAGDGWIVKWRSK